VIFIDNQHDFDAAMDRVAAQPVVALDTEADSLHSYFDKVCLIQMSIPGEDLIIDPLCKFERAVEMANDWGSYLIELGAVGHLNPAAGYGEWPRAEEFIRALSK